MKNILSILIIVTFVDFGQAQKNKQNKTLKFSDYKLEYPKTWKTHKFNGYIMFMPKNLKDTDYLGPNPIYVFPNTISNPGESIIKKLEKHASVLNGHEKEKNFKIIEFKGKGKFHYKVEYDILMDFSDIRFKKEEYVFLSKSKLKYCYYIMRQDLFDKYYDEAMSIINSLERR